MKRYNIWGNVFLYCFENHINFAELVYNISQDGLIAEKQKAPIDWIMYRAGKLSQRRKSQSAIDRYIETTGMYMSTTEYEIDLLVNKYHIPYRAIVDFEHFEERMLDFLMYIYKSRTLMYDFFVEEKENQIVISKILFNQRINESDSNITDLLFYIEDPQLGFDEMQLVKTFDLDSLTFAYSINLIPNIPYAYGQHRTMYPWIGPFDRDGGSLQIFAQQTKSCVTDFINELYFTSYIENPILKYDAKIIDFKDVVVKSTIRKCDNEDHHTELIEGIIFLIEKKTNKIIYKDIPLLYCHECNVYYLYEFDYNALRIIGRPLLRLYTKKPSGNMIDFQTLSTESIFKICGYTVDANEGVSDNTRRNILKFLIQRNIVSLTQTLNFLHWLIDTRKNNRNMYHAVKKWESDLKFIEREYTNPFKFVVVGRN